MTKVQPDTSALVEELSTLRRDTNTLFENQPAFRRGSHKQIDPAENISVEGDYESTEVKHRLPKKLSKQVHAKLGNEPQINGSKQNDDVSENNSLSP